MRIALTLVLTVFTDFSLLLLIISNQLLLILL